MELIAPHDIGTIDLLTIEVQSTDAVHESHDKHLPAIIGSPETFKRTCLSRAGGKGCRTLRHITLAHKSRSVRKHKHAPLNTVDQTTLLPVGEHQQQFLSPSLPTSIDFPAIGLKNAGTRWIKRQL